MGLSHYVYTGATHSRFEHALGAMHLMSKALGCLQTKGTVISKTESEAALIAILLHDLGHGPFSHALEGVFSRYRCGLRCALQGIMSLPLLRISL